MRVTEIWQSRDRPTLSLEFFPPRTSEAAEKLDKSIANLSELKPDFVSVTFGAGGSTRDGSRQLVGKLKNEVGFEVLAYFAGYGLSPDQIFTVLNDYRNLGVESVLVVRGDKPRYKDLRPHPGGFNHASELIEFVRPRFDFCVGVAGYPEGHSEAESKEKDVEYLRLKVDKGAEYIITNYFYDNRFFFEYVERCRSAGIDVPILPGVMPIYGLRSMERSSAICGASITEQVRMGIAGFREDDTKSLREFGVEFAVDQCRELLEAGVPGIHFYTINRSLSTIRIVEQLRGEGLI
jgi:methylenetetrahydrofolate reductase (NADPH)